MQNLFHELTPIEYSKAGVKLLNINVQKGSRCFRLHWHERMEIIKMNSGTLLIDFNEEKISLNANEIYIIPPKFPHTAIAESDATYNVIMFDVRSLYNGTRLSSEVLEPVFIGNAKFHIKTDNADILNCCNEIINTDKNNEFFTLSLLYKFIDLLYKNCLLEFSAVTNADRVINNAVKYIEENYTEKISTDFLAKKCGYSSEHFCRKFKETTRLSPMRYLKIHRLEESAKLLKTRNFSVTEIALLCGFDDANYFTRCFKEHFGVSPTKYLKQ